MKGRKLALPVIALMVVMATTAVHPAVASHARPRGATPLRAPMVPAFKTCVAPNRTHALPLSFPSCTPPVQESPNLTMGSPDANGAVANLIASVTFRTVGVPGGADDEDVQVVTSVIDVRCKAGVATCSGSNAQDGPDYTGELEGTATLRITDHNSGTGGAETATLVDFDLPYEIGCVATASTAIGATCDLTTSFNAQIPGSVPETKRIIAELEQVTITDGGPDGAAATPDNAPFLVQGIFAP